MNKFTLQQYRDLIARLSDTKIVLCRDFGRVKNNCITVRHDIDSLDYLLKISINYLFLLKKSLNYPDTNHILRIMYRFRL